MSDQNITKRENIIRISSYCLPALALLLSALSATGLCMGGCNSLSNYRIFGTSFAVSGIVYFTLILATLYVTNRLGKLNQVVDFLAVAGLGAEIWFIVIQKFVVQKWCPLCLSIAATLLLFTLLRGFQAWQDRKPWKYNGVSHGKWLLVHVGKMAVVAMLLGSGFVVALVSVGVKKVALNERAKEMEAAAAEINRTTNPLSEADIWSGNKKSPIKVYFVTDWYCDYCRKVEPVIEKTLPELAKKASYTWIDMPIHRESTNLIPYALNVLLHDKEHYLQARHALQDLTKEGKEVPESRVRSAIKSVANVPEPDKSSLSVLFVDILMFTKANRVNQTPSVIIFDTRTGGRQILTGADQITEENLMNTVNTQ